MNKRVIVVSNEEEFNQALDIRKDVFVEEQQVPLDIEVDQYEQVATHVLAYDEEGRPVATGRIREYKPGVGKFERIAVRQEARTGGYGRLVMMQLEEVGREKGFGTFVLEAQTHAEKFYEKLGYINVSPEPFLEAGIWHVRMEKQA